MMGYDKSIICIFKMSFLNYVADLEEWYLSLANMPQHKSRGHKIRRKEVRKQGFSEPRICLGGGRGILSGVEVIYPPHHKLQSFQHTRPRGITSHSHNDRGRWL